MKSRPNTDDGEGVRSALRERLKKTNSLREVANEVGLSWATVSALLKGSGPIGQATLLKLCSGAAPQVAEEANKILSARRAELLRRIAQRAARGLRPYKRWEQDAAALDPQRGKKR
jgi:transcriptional regulator with XRE-family HTH domain